MKRAAFDQIRNVWANACEFGQMHCAFDQTSQQWPNANEFGKMRMHMVNCAAHLAKYIQN